MQKGHMNNRGYYVVTAGITNNGILGRTDKKSKIFQANTITVDMFGNANYRNFDYKMVTHARVFSLKAKFEMSEKIGLFIVNLFKKFSKQFGYENMCSWQKIKDCKIKIPIKKDQINFEYMKEIIELIEVQRVDVLKKYIISNKLDDYELTMVEQKIIQNFENINWQEFAITKVFDIKNTKNILSREIVENSGNIPYLCASSERNAVSSYISYNEKYLDKGNCIFIGGKTFVVTYQKQNFYSNDSHNLALYVKDSEKITSLEQLFLVACIDKGLSNKYSWGNSISGAKIKNDKLVLPVCNGNIDFKLMNTIILAVQKKIIKKIVKYLENKTNKKE